MNEHPLKKLQFLFRELFQFDFADLDFGLYRLFHLKRAEIEAFISEQLPREVDAAFETVVGEERGQLQAELDALAQQVREQIAEDAILPTGEIQPKYLESNARVVRELAEQYEAVRQKVAVVQVTEEHKAKVFNYLYDFFKRYYEDGDFIPKRRYGMHASYAVPYNGEEVFFHWANRGQHYVKTAERFRDYAFKLRNLTGKYRVRFTMAEASVPKDNTKGNIRYFFPRPDLATYNTETHEFTLPFEYRLPTPEEGEQYGNNNKAQGAILEEALPRILEAMPDANLRALLSQPVDESEEAPTVLLKRLRHFCRRNTSDYFIHKDLRGFLTRELEFYIKDQIIHLMDLEADLGAKRRVVRTFRKLAEKVIDFLATIENAQKTLFEKKKFVLETDYLISIRYVPRAFWPEVLQNEGQLKEWRRWLALEPGEVNEAFLEAHPTLPVHTKHFDRSFVRRLLEKLPFENLDETTDGLLVHGENYQALRLLMERYREQVKCIYIDPPFNSPSTEIIYKNGYKHSTWLTLIEGRLRLSKSYLTKDGSCVVAIDKHEHHRLLSLLEDLFSVYDITSVSVEHNKKGQQGDHFSDTNEYAIFIVPYALKELNRLKRAEEDWEWSNFRNWGGESLRSDGANCFYPIYVKDGKIVGFGDVCPDDFHPESANVALKDGIIAIYPIDDHGVERKWRYERGTVEGIQHLLKIERSRSGVLQIMKAKTDDQFKTMWYLPKYSAGDYGTKLLTNMGFPKGSFSFPKSVYTVKDSVFAVSDKTAIVYDFFAGFGTTGHAVINLNREDGGRRKFILVEMAEYFDTVLLPRIAKVMYTPEWKDGKPKRKATPEEAERTPRLVKILRLESYEDTLHNLAAPSTLECAAKFEVAYKQLVGEDAYHLRYWIKLPLREAETCLRALDLAYPFAYSLEILTDNGPVRKPVDVVETFNYLYGLRVRRHETWCNPADDNREYRAVKATDRDGKRRILVLWRDMAGLDAETERAFLEAKITEMEANGETWNEILINGDSPTPGVTSLDPLFKRLMMQGEEA
jgi:adenine-specific DNA-methyltransferase